jgi:hypothetical protein
MDKFIHRENLTLFRGRFDDPGLTDAQRRAILRLLIEEHDRGHTTLDEGSRAMTGLILFAAAPSAGECSFS